MPTSLNTYPAYTQADKRSLGVVYRKRFAAFKSDARYFADVAFRQELAGIAVLDVMAEEFAANVALGIYPDVQLSRTEARDRYLDGVRSFQGPVRIPARWLTKLAQNE